MLSAGNGEKQELPRGLKCTTEEKQTARRAWPLTRQTVSELALVSFHSVHLLKTCVVKSRLGGSLQRKHLQEVNLRLRYSDHQHRTDAAPHSRGTAQGEKTHNTKSGERLEPRLLGGVLSGTTTEALLCGTYYSCPPGGHNPATPLLDTHRQPHAHVPEGLHPMCTAEQPAPALYRTHRHTASTLSRATKINHCYTQSGQFSKDPRF